MSVNKPLTLFIGAQWHNGRQHNLYLRGYVAKETEKAVQICVDGDTLWLPKAVLKPERDDPTHFSLTRWFKPDAYAGRYFELHRIELT